jgi:hypothetical protein
VVEHRVPAVGSGVGADGIEEGVGDVRGAFDGCQVDCPDAIAPVRSGANAGFEGEPRLADSTRTEADAPSRGRAPDAFHPNDPASPTLGYAIGAGAYRVSPRALLEPERFGPLARSHPEPSLDAYLTGSFRRDVPFQSSAFEDSIHRGSYEVLFERAELCGTCHDVTNPLTIMNAKGRWVGGFPIERTYSEWASSRYADRPGNEHFDPAFKRDCQTCHMQQHFGQAGTAQTLFDASGPAPPLGGRPADKGPERPVYYSHHFVGGNGYTAEILGVDVASDGSVAPYPELSSYSFSSALALKDSNELTKPRQKCGAR